MQLALSHATRRDACRLEERTWEPVWVTAEDVAAEGLLLSKHMLLDHLPDRTVAILSRTHARLNPEAAAPSERALHAAAEPLPGSAQKGSAGRLGRKTSVTDVRSRRGPASETERLLPLRDGVG